MFINSMFAKMLAPRSISAKKTMSLQTIFNTAFSTKVVTPEMDEALRSLLWSREFSQQEMESLALMTRMLASGEIIQLKG